MSTPLSSFVSLNRGRSAAHRGNPRNQIRSLVGFCTDAGTSPGRAARPAMVRRRLRQGHRNRPANATANRRPPDVRRAEDRSIAPHHPGTRANTRPATRAPGIASRRPPSRRRPLERSRPRVREHHRHSVGAPQRRPRLARRTQRSWPRRDAAARLAARVRDLPSRLRSFTAHRHEDTRPQPDLADHEHLRARPAGDRTGCRGRRCPASFRMIKNANGCTNGCTYQTTRPSLYRLGDLSWAFVGAPPGTRTPNPRIKSPLLCQLS
jgi:hypothetical protein